MLDLEKLTLPDGFELTPELKTELAGVFDNTGVSQTAAQKLVDFHTRTINGAVKAVNDAYESRSDEWAKAVRDDATIGGANLDVTVRTVSKALDVFGAPGVKEALDLTRAGNHPAIVKTFYNMAKALSEGGHIQGKPPGTAVPESAAKAIYPNLP